MQSWSPNLPRERCSPLAQSAGKTFLLQVETRTDPQGTQSGKVRHSPREKPWNAVGLLPVARVAKCLIWLTCSSPSRGTI